MVTVFRFVCLDAFSCSLKEFSRLHYCSIIKVRRCCFPRQLCYISTACRFLSTPFLFFRKTFFARRRSLETYHTLWLLLFLVLFPVVFDDFAILSDVLRFCKHFFYFLCFFINMLFFFAFFYDICA